MKLDEAEDILTIKRKDHQLEGGEVNEYEEPIESKNDLPEGKIKVITKTQMAKKVLKKNIQANQKITFDDATGEGTVEGLTQKVNNRMIVFCSKCYNCFGF